MAAINPIGIETIPGFSSGKIARSPIASGLNAMSANEESSPQNMPAIAPVREKRRHVSARTITGTFALAATAKARPTKKATL